MQDHEMISSHCLCYFVFISFVSFACDTVWAAQFSVSTTRVIDVKPSPNPPSESDSTYIQLSSPENQVFGFSANGVVTANLNFSSNITTPPTDPSSPARLSLCQVSDALVRGPNYQRRQIRGAFSDLKQSFATTACRSDKQVDQQATTGEAGLAWCISCNLSSDKTNYSFSVQSNNLQPNQMYLIGAVFCAKFSDQQTVNVSLQGHIEFLNPDLLFPQLGFEEATFPVFAGIIIVLLGLPFLILTLALLFATHRHMPIRFTVRFVMVAIFLKTLGAILTFVHFYALAQTGIRQSWYLYVRLLLASSADILFIIAVVSISSGYAVLANSWFVEDRSPIFLVYIGVVLQLLIIIAVKIMFPFEYLGAVTYTIAGSSIALIATISSYRNSCFLYRFGQLIERAHIFLKSTPIYQLRIFYIINIGIVTVAYVIKIISVILFDYQLSRPDLLWGTMEMVDAVLLVWYAAFVFPRRKSALYVNMANLSNDRLHQAERWRARQLTRQTSNETNPSTSSGALLPAGFERRNESSSATMPGSEDRSPRSGADRNSSHVRLVRQAQRFLGRGRAQHSRPRPTIVPNTTSEALDLRTESAGGELDPQPPWIVWTSGTSLPRPNRYTWRGYHTDGGVPRQENSEPPSLQTPIVIGSPEASSEIVKLTVGIPVTGTNIIRRAFDEKGAEISETPEPRSTLAESPTSVNERNVQYTSGASRLNIGLSIRRRNRAVRNAQECEETESQTQRQVAQEAGMPSNEATEGGRDSTTGQISRTVSSSTTETCRDGIVRNIDDDNR